MLVVAEILTKAGVTPPERLGGAREVADFAISSPSEFSVRFRRAPSTAALLDTETRAESIRRVVQDYMLPWSGLQKKLRGITDATDVYRAEDRSYGLQRNGIHQMDKTYIEPVERILIDNGISKEEFSQFLMAKAGPDRNKMIADRTDGKNLTGSGRADAYWGNILNGYRALGKLDAMMKAGQIVWDMNRHALDLKVANGLMSRAQADVWKTMSPFYVPYRSDDSDNSTRRYYTALDKYDAGMYRMKGYKTKQEKDKLVSELPYCGNALSERIKSLNSRIKDLRDGESTAKTDGRKRHLESQRLRLQQIVVNLVENGG